MQDELQRLTTQKAYINTYKDMPKNSRLLHLEFQDKVRELNRIRLSFENAFTNGSINRFEITKAYAGLYLDLFTEFESLLEKLFIGLLVGDIFHDNRLISRKVKISPKQNAENVIFGGQKYLKWLPYVDTINRSSIFLVQGKPFTDLSDQDRNHLNKYLVIRHGVAHKSKKTMTEFINLIQGINIPPEDKTPERYLRVVPQGSGQTQLEIISHDLLRMVHIICCNQMPSQPASTP